LPPTLKLALSLQEAAAAAKCAGRVLEWESKAVLG